MEQAGLMEKSMFVAVMVLWPAFIGIFVTNILADETGLHILAATLIGCIAGGGMSYLLLRMWKDNKENKEKMGELLYPDMERRQYLEEELQKKIKEAQIREKHQKTINRMKEYSKFI